MKLKELICQESKYYLLVNYLGLSKVFLTFYSKTQEEIFYECCNNILTICKQLASPITNINCQKILEIITNKDHVVGKTRIINNVLSISCKRGHIKVAKWLYSLGGIEMPYIYDYGPLFDVPP
jgi:hypothetical protein